jgi:hypothetical protein
MFNVVKNLMAPDECNILVSTVSSNGSSEKQNGNDKHTDKARMD